MSAKVGETGWYGQILGVPGGLRARRKLALTCTDAYAMGRSLTAEGGVQVAPPSTPFWLKVERAGTGACHRRVAGSPGDAASVRRPSTSTALYGLTTRPPSSLRIVLRSRE